jgi:hypothetical protein
MLFYILIPAFRKSLEPGLRFTLQIDSDVRDGFIGQLMTIIETLMYREIEI